MLQFEKIENGTKLKITCPLVADLNELIQTSNEVGDITAFIEGADSYLCNGWFMISPEDIGALTDNPFMLTDDADLSEVEGFDHVGRVYYYDAYMLRNPLVDIVENGFVIFNSAE